MQTVSDLDSLMSSNKAALPRAEVARVLNVDERTVSRAIAEKQLPSLAEKQLPSLQIGRRILVPRLPLVALLTDTQDAA